MADAQIWDPVYLLRPANQVVPAAPFPFVLAARRRSKPRAAGETQPRDNSVPVLHLTSEDARRQSLPSPFRISDDLSKPLLDMVGESAASNHSDEVIAIWGNHVCLANWRHSPQESCLPQRE